MENTLQHQETTQCSGLPPASPRNHRRDGPEAGHALTLKLDHSGGADQFVDSFYVDPDGDQIINEGQEIQVGDGNHTVFDGVGSDTIFGGSGQDRFFAGDGADAYDGGGSTDIVFYSTSSTGLTIDTGNSALSTGTAQGDTYTSIEQVRGTNANDTITSGGVSRVYGEAGDDVVIDRGANAWGGSGADVFVFDQMDSSGFYIGDFTRGDDLLDVSGWGVTDLSELTITPNSSNSSKLKVSYTNGNSETDSFELYVIGVQGGQSASLDASDFIFL